MPNARLGRAVDLGPINDRLDSLEQQQKSTFDRTGLILEELQEAKKERAELKGDMKEIKEFLKILALHNGLPFGPPEAPVPPTPPTPPAPWEDDESLTE